MAVDGRQPMISFAKVVSGHIDNDCSSTAATAAAAAAGGGGGGEQTTTPIAVQSQSAASSESGANDERKIQSQASPGSKRHRGHRHRGEKRHREALPDRQQPAHETVAVDESVEVVLEPAPLPAVNAWFKQASSKQGRRSTRAPTLPVHTVNHKRR